MIPDLILVAIPPILKKMKIQSFDSEFGLVTLAIYC